MRILDLLVLSFHRELKDKTTFKILNQSMNSCTYCYDIKDNKFKKCIDKIIIDGIYLGVDAENALWEIEIIDDLIENPVCINKENTLDLDTVYNTLLSLRNTLNEVVEKVNKQER